MSDDIGTAGDGAGGGSTERPEPDRRPPGTARASPVPVRRADGACAAVEPLTPRELSRSLVRPDLMTAHVLGSADRMARNLSDGGSLGLLVAVLAAASVVATIPFGTFFSAARFWNVSALYAGSLLICFPCLHVVLQFTGFKIDLVRNLSLALVITATAGLFTLGFFPIIWFIGLTTRAGDGAVVTPADLARFLLAVSLLMGIVQMSRCLASFRSAARDRGGMTATIFLWLPLLVFITWRMAGVLGIRG